MLNNLCFISRRLLFATWLAAAAFLPVSLSGEGARAQEECPLGRVQTEVQSLGELLLPEGAPPYTTTTLTRLVVQPGDALTPAADAPELYFVEAGSLDYRLQPNIGVMGGSECILQDEDGNPQASGGFILQSANGVVTISQGQAIIAEHGMLGSLVNNGTIPLVLLRVSVLAPKIDPATGLPIVDPATAGREQARARDELKEACKAETRAKRKGFTQASPLPEDDAEEQPRHLATPAVSTTGWGGDAAHEQRALPKACREQ